MGKGTKKIKREKTYPYQSYLGQGMIHFTGEDMVPREDFSAQRTLASMSDEEKAKLPHDIRTKQPVVLAPRCVAYMIAVLASHDAPVRSRAGKNASPDLIRTVIEDTKLEDLQFSKQSKDMGVIHHRVEVGSGLTRIED